MSPPGPSSTPTGARRGGSANTVLPLATADDPSNASPSLDRDARLSSAVRRGYVFSMLNTLIARLVGIGTSVVLTRILTPADYGVFGIAMLLLAALQTVKDLGFGLALTRWQGDPRALIPTVASLSLVSSLVLYGCLYVAAAPVAEVLGASEATGLVRALGVSVIVESFTAAPNAMLARGFLQGRRLVADVGAALSNTAVTVFLAADGRGPWSFTIGYLVGTTVYTASVVGFQRSDIGFGWNANLARQLLGFGLPITGAGLLNIAIMNVDYAVVGALLGPRELGVYTLAFTLSSWPVNAFSMAARRITVPAFAQSMSDIRQFEAVACRTLERLLYLSLPICAFLGLAADALIDVVYGSRWSGSVGPLRWLAVFGGARIVIEVLYDMLVALGRSRAVLVAHTIWFLALLFSLTAAARFGGVAAVGAGQAAVAVLLEIPLFLYFVTKQGIVLGRIARTMLKPFGYACGYGATALIVIHLAPNELVKLIVLLVVVAPFMSHGYSSTRSQRAVRARHRRRGRLSGYRQPWS